MDRILVRRHKGKWRATSRQTPIFCFEADTKAEVERQANTALEYYESIKDKLPELVAKKRTELGLT